MIGAAVVLVSTSLTVAPTPAVAACVIPPMAALVHANVDPTVELVAV